MFTSLLAFTVNSYALIGSRAPIAIDGPLKDWNQVELAHVDPGGDGINVDFRRVWLAHDDEFLFLRFETTAEIDLAEDNDLRIYLDTDADALTGLPVAGIGAELEWQPGLRSGVFRPINGVATTVFQNDIGFRGAPTVTASEFEIAFARNARPDQQNLLFAGPEVRLVMTDGGGDQLPDDAGGIRLVFSSDEPVELTPIPIDRKTDEDLRLTTFNVLNDGLWGDNAASFERLVKAAAPDIISFQEIRDHTPDESLGLVQSWLPDQPWFAAGHSDCHTISTYPIVESWPLDDNLATLIDTRNLIGTDLLVINAHLPCCDNDQGRQAEIDRIMAFVRDAKSGEQGLTLAEGTPIVMTGDMNLVGLAQQLRTLLAGDIVDEIQFGPDFDPDWNGSDLINGVSRQTHKAMGYTWRNDGSTFWPGHLDYVIYTGSVLQRSHHYVMYTPDMAPQILFAHGLSATDSLASDHLLFVSDFRRIVCNGDVDRSGFVNRADLDALFRAWGACPDCAEDLNGDGFVASSDLKILFQQWGSCP